MSLPLIEIDGGPADAAGLAALALSDYGHFTAMQVRGGAARGLGLHLSRLDSASREMFGAGLDRDLVRRRIRHALGGTPDASVRVMVYQPGAADQPAVAVTVRPPAGPPDRPQSLLPVPYLRPAAHLKHLGDFGQAYYDRLAAARGYDSALLTGPGGVIAEGAITNVAFFDGTTVTWPDAPCLAGVTMQLIEPALASAGLPARRAPVRLEDLAAVTAAVVTNARGVAPVHRIDATEIPLDEKFLAAVRGSYETVPWDAI